MAAQRSGAGAGAGRGAGWSDCQRQTGRNVSELLLLLRLPARALCGSLRAAIIVLAAVFTLLLLSEATFLGTKWNLVIVRDNESEDSNKHPYGLLFGIALLVALSNVVLIFGVMTSKLHYLYAWMSVAIVNLFVPIPALFWVNVELGNKIALVCFFYLSHFSLQLLLLALVYGLAHELRGGRFLDYGGGGGGGGGGGEGAGGGGGYGGSDGWLQLNLASARPPQPGEARAKPRSPAVLEPSACTTAPPPTAPLSTHC